MKPTPIQPNAQADLIQAMINLDAANRAASLSRSATQRVANLGTAYALRRSYSSQPADHAARAVCA